MLKFGSAAYLNNLKIMTPLTNEGPASLRPGLREGKVWPTGRKITFRFAFIYLMLHMTPWSPASAIPWFYHITKYYDMGWDWTVRFFNTHFFGVAENLVSNTGSSDTSFAWAALLFLLCFSVIATTTWSVLDNRRKNYEAVDYWLRICVRYYIASNCFAYGVVKLFALQMWFPTLSQLATPLGDFLPMRFSWMFVWLFNTIPGILWSDGTRSRSFTSQQENGNPGTHHGDGCLPARGCSEPVV